MKTAEEIKNSIAVKYGYPNWHLFLCEIDANGYDEDKLSVIIDDLISHIRLESELSFLKADMEKKEKIQDINFIKWYSGMDEVKIINAYKRYIKESKTQ